MMPPRRYGQPLLWLGLWLVLLWVSLYSRCLVPVDETRYVAVAWEMWLRDSFLVPYLNGEPYHHKPPLLFWLIQLSWSLLGVHEWVARLISPLFGLGSLFLTARLACWLWPEDCRTRLEAPLVLLSGLGWAVLTSALMFDTLIVFFSLLGLLGILRSWREGGWGGWIILGLAIGLGILAKGPVILLYTLPVALLAPWWMEEKRPVAWKGWYLGILASIGLGAAIALGWALPAAWLGGEEYRHAIFWGQTAGRMVESFAHRRPFWWYLPLLPVMLFPWLIWPPVWRGLVKMKLDWGARFCLAWLLTGLLAVSLISGKQIHYLLPLFPPFALLATRAMTGQAGGRFDAWIPGVVFMLLGCALSLLAILEAWHELPAWLGKTSPAWGLAVIAGGWLLARYWLRGTEGMTVRLALSSLVLVVVANIGVVRVARDYYDGTTTSQQLAILQNQDIPIAHTGRYDAGQFQFAGRLKKPINKLARDEIAPWIAQYPSGHLLLYSKTLDGKPLAQVKFHQPYQGGYVLIVAGQALLENLNLLEK